MEHILDSNIYKYEAFDPLYLSEPYLDISECEAGYLYLVYSRSIGELAICAGFNEGATMTFNGWRNKLGCDFMFTELHFDSDEMFGTVQPLLKLCAAPKCDGDKLLEWLLGQYIDLQHTKIEWLLNMPQKFKRSEIFPDILLEEKEKLADYELVKKEGFSAHPVPTFKEILSKIR